MTESDGESDGTALMARDLERLRAENNELKRSVERYRDAVANAGPKAAEEGLARLNNKHEAILRSAAEGILGLDLEGNHTFVNETAARCACQPPTSQEQRDEIGLA
jgi:PAS domain-containing protein